MNRLILASGSTFTVGAGSSLTTVFGTTGNETLSIGVGAKVVLDASFNRGGDTITLAGNAASYTARQSGSSVILTDASGSEITIPVGVTGASVAFADAAARTLVFNTQTNAITLGADVVDATADALAAGSSAVAGRAFNLTAGIDSGAAFAGGAGDDTYSAIATTFSAGDVLNGGAGKDTLAIVDNVAGMGIAAPSATLTSIEALTISTNGRVGVQAVQGTTAVAQVNTISFTGAVDVGDRYSVTYNGVTQASAGSAAATAAGAATVVANTINAMAGSSIAAVSGNNVVVTAPVAGTPLPAFSVAVVDSTNQTGLPSIALTTANVVGVAGVTAAAYDVSSFTSLTDATVSADGAVNLKAAGTQNVAITSGAGVTLAGGLAQNVTAKGGFTVSGGKGAVTVVDSAQGAVASSVTDGTSVNITSTSRNDNGTTGTITVGSNTNAPTGAVAIKSTISEVKSANNTAGGAITVTGGTSVSVDQVAVKALNDAGSANGSITNAAVTVTGTASTTSVSVAATKAVAAAATVAAVAGVTEVATLTFTTLANNTSATVNGLTFTNTSGGTLTAQQVAAAFANLSAGATHGASTRGVYSGTFSTEGWTSGAVGGTTAAPTVTFTGTTTGARTDLGTGTGISAATTVTDGVTAVAAAGRTGVVANSVTVTDVNNGSTTKAGTITSVTAANYTTVTVNSNALNTLSLTGGSGNITIGNGSLVGNTATTLNLTVNGLTGGTLDDADVYKTINVTATGANSTLANITNTALTALTVGGDKTLTLTSTAGATALANVTVTGAAGVTATFGAGTMKAIDTTGTTGTSTITFDATLATYTGGAGSDRVTTSAVAPSKAIDLGAGDDRLQLAQGTNSVTGAISGGSGTDRLIMTAADAATADNDLAFSALVTGFEVLQLIDVSNQSVNLANLGITSNVVIGNRVNTGTLQVANLVRGGTVTVNAQTGAADVVEFDNAAWRATGASSDSLNINLGSSAGNTNENNGTVQTKGIESIALSATHATADTNGVDIAAGTFKNTVAVNDTSTTDSLASLTITGNAGVILDVAGSTALRTIDASANTGGVTVTAASTLAATLTGGSGNDSLTATTGTNADVLNGGAGNDTLTSNQGLTTLTGGAGRDLFVVATAGANGNVYTTITDAAAGDRLELSNRGTETFATARLNLAATATFADYLNLAASGDGSLAGRISWFQFNGNTYVVEDLSAGATFANGSDIVVALSGLVDLSTASLAYNVGGAPVLMFG